MDESGFAKSDEKALSLSAMPRLGFLPCLRLEAQMPPEKEKPRLENGKLAGTVFCRGQLKSSPKRKIQQWFYCLHGRAPSNQFAQILTPIGRTASPRWRVI
jgi:hypothetical protein